MSLLEKYHGTRAKVWKSFNVRSVKIPRSSFCKANVHTTALASAALGDPPLGTTVTLLALFPFRLGISNTLLFPPATPFHLPNSDPSGIVHVKAPTQGCTFHPICNVTFPLSASLPVISVI